MTPPAPHEAPCGGPAAAFADRLAGMVPTLGTDRTRLRCPRLPDFPAWAEIMCGPRSAYMGGPSDRDEAFGEFAAYVGSWLLRGIGCWALEDRATGEALGFVCVALEPGDREPELGFFLRERAEGRGLALEAAAAARDWAWSQALPSLVSYVDPANARSVALARRLGATRDAAAEAAFAGTPDEGIAVFRHPRPEARA